MNKIAIATIFYVCNYGTVLQAFATQQILRRLGYVSEIIQYIPERVSLKRAFFNRGLKNTKKSIISLLSKIAGISKCPPVIARLC